MTRIYIAGAYSDDNVISVLKNIGRGQHWAAMLFKKGFAPFCPWHDKEFVIHFYDSEFTVQEFYDYSIAWLEVSDAVFIVPNATGLKRWQDSAGTLKEIEIAEKLNIPIFYSLPELIQWNTKHL